VFGHILKNKAISPSDWGKWLLKWFHDLFCLSALEGYVLSQKFQFHFLQLTNLNHPSELQQRPLSP